MRWIRFDLAGESSCSGTRLLEAVLHVFDASLAPCTLSRPREHGDAKHWTEPGQMATSGRVYPAGYGVRGERIVLAEDPALLRSRRRLAGGSGFTPMADDGGDARNCIEPA